MDPQYMSDAAPPAGLPTRPVRSPRGRRLPKRRAALLALALIALLVVAGPHRDLTGNAVEAEVVERRLDLHRVTAVRLLDAREERLG